MFDLRPGAIVRDLDLDMVDTVRKTWAFYRDRRPDAYDELVTTATRFWNASGLDVDFGLFSGLKIKTESLEAILAGGDCIRNTG